MSRHDEGNSFFNNVAVSQQNIKIGGHSHKQLSMLCWIVVAVV